MARHTDMASVGSLDGGADALRLESDWLRDVIETAVDAIIVISEQGLIQYMNPAGVRMFGYTLDEVIGESVSLLIPAPHRQRHGSYIAEYLRTGQAKVIGTGREVTYCRKDGEIFPAHLSVSEVMVGDRRMFTGILCDISREKVAQEEQRRLLDELKERNKRITCLYSVGEVIRASEIETDLFHNVVGLVRPACYRPEITRALLVFDDQTYVDKAFERTPWRFSENIIAGGRTRGVLEVYYLDVLEDDPQAQRFLEEDRNLIEAIARTLGETVERREAEAQVVQASKLASIGELAAGVGHEINNPINGIMNCADILIGQLQDAPKALQFAELIRSEADRVATIVRNLLTFSRQDREQRRPARLCDIVNAVLSLCGKRITKSHIDLRQRIPEDLPEVNCRHEQMQQVVMNLIINAIHALDDRYPEMAPKKVLTLTGKTITRNREPFIRLTVEDRGTGIPPALRDRLFDPFFTTKGRDKGTGLGLSVSDGIVRDHGGFISVESDVGRYARFHVDLPLLDPETGTTNQGEKR